MMIIIIIIIIIYNKKCSYSNNGRPGDRIILITNRSTETMATTEEKQQVEQLCKLTAPLARKNMYKT